MAMALGQTEADDEPSTDLDRTSEANAWQVDDDEAADMEDVWSPEHGAPANDELSTAFDARSPETEAEVPFVEPDRDEPHGTEPIGEDVEEAVASATAEPASAKHDDTAPADGATDDDGVFDDARATVEGDRSASSATAMQLTSAATGEKVAASFDDLTRMMAAESRRSFDEIAEEMLRPMLREWLDDNLPTLVERLVREEIERVARGTRR
ncbi:DUF2497 domain-containing protein [Pararhizobium mangrovi]|uniref:DUF2497 domain-containing protein n=2 Tax=Pararhizobium mangrovi TaxID=2590452 RepID=A0A506U9V6_9HYPH|nr:DUF2497 domain-containing protein [Pararhizobium mangrovi]